MRKENEAEIEKQPEGVCWAGCADNKAGLVHVEAYFKMTPVILIRDIYLGSGGNMQETLEFLNRDRMVGEEPYIKREEVIDVVDWFSRNPIFFIEQINKNE